MELTKNTTREHYEKYATLSENMIDWLNIRNLPEKFLADENLNNIPLQVFDAYFWINHAELSRRKKINWGGFSLAENVCMMKHILIYRVLKATPIFKD